MILGLTKSLFSFDDASINLFEYSSECPKIKSCKSWVSDLSFSLFLMLEALPLTKEYQYV